MTRAGKIETAIAVTLAVALGAGAGFLMSSEDRSHLFPEENVAAIAGSLDQAESLASQGKCFQALKPAGEAQAQAEALPASVDPALKRSLIDGVVTLTLRIGNQCTESDTPDGTTGATGVTGDTGTTETETETTPTGETGTTADDTETGTTGKQDQQKNDKPKTPKPDPQPTPDPVVPPKTDPPVATPPVQTGPGSGGISPNQ